MGAVLKIGAILSNSTVLQYDVREFYADIIILARLILCCEKLTRETVFRYILNTYQPPIFSLKQYPTTASRCQLRNGKPRPLYKISVQHIKNSQNHGGASVHFWQIRLVTSCSSFGSNNSVLALEGESTLDQLPNKKTEVSSYKVSWLVFDFDSPSSKWLPAVTLKISVLPFRSSLRRNP
jgi:hypothetical protein